MTMLQPTSEGQFSSHEGPRLVMHHVSATHPVSISASERAEPASIPAKVTNSGQSTSINRKSRVSLACKRCKRRKQRCDGTHPSCKSCEKAGLACTYERILRPQYPGGKSMYINVLEERIAFLEASLPGHAEDHLENGFEEPQKTPLEDIASSPPMDAEEFTSSTQRRRGSHFNSQRGSISEDPELDDSISLVDGVAYLSLCASGTTDTTHEPYYLGSSSGAIIARVIQSQIYRGSGNRTLNLSPASHEKEEPGTATSSEPVISPDSDEPRIEFPDKEQARLLFDFFFERIHPRWPLLDRVVYESLFQKQHIPGALTITERSIFHLIYAITARFLAVTRKPCGVDDELQLVAATGPMDHILKQHNLATVQFLILLGVHGQRSPYGAGAWSQIRYATSVCIEMGLHRRRTSSGFPAHTRDAEIRRRAFWSCYCLDRVTSIVLGRSFAIADRDINVELPSANVEFWTLTHKESPDPNRGQWSNVQPFIHIIKLDRIQSRIHKAVFRVDRDVFKGTPEERSKLDKKMGIIRNDLDEWIQTFPQTPKQENKSTWMYDPESAYHDARDFYDVQYHKAILYLFTVFLPVLDTSDSRFITCARSAACVCNAYKRLSQNKTLTYTMISLHSCFVAGLTLVYCIWRDHTLFSYDALEATQACSQILTIFGEKWPGAVKYRDIFDALSGSLFRLTFNPPQMISHTRNHQPLQLNMEAGPLLTTGPTDRHEEFPPIVSEISKGAAQPTISHLVTDAVKEAFMEVDEEAPGGWQGWRMWNEMVRDESATVPNPAFGSGVTGYRPPDMSWNAYDGSGVYGVDPIQNATMQMGHNSMMNQNQWNLTEHKQW